MSPTVTSPIALVLVSMSALAFLYCVGLLIAHLCWKTMRLGERLAIAPFCSITMIIIAMKILQQFLGVWFMSLPQPWVFWGMNTLTALSIAILIQRYWSPGK